MMFAKQRAATQAMKSASTTITSQIQTQQQPNNDEIAAAIQAQELLNRSGNEFFWLEPQQQLARSAAAKKRAPKLGVS